MKKLLSVLVVTLFASLSFAQTAVTLPETLKETMENMGRNLKVIATQFSDPTQKESLTAASVDLVLLTVHAQTKVPTKVQEMDANAQPEMIAKFKSMMSQTSVVAVKITAALQSGQNNLIPALLMEIKALRKDGHAEFTEE